MIKYTHTHMEDVILREGTLSDSTKNICYELNGERECFQMEKKINACLVRVGTLYTVQKGVSL